MSGLTIYSPFWKTIFWNQYWTSTFSIICLQVAKLQVHTTTHIFTIEKVSDKRKIFLNLQFYQKIIYNVTGLDSSHKHQLINETYESGEQMGVDFKKYSLGENNITFAIEYTWVKCCEMNFDQRCQRPKTVNIHRGCSYDWVKTACSKKRKAINLKQSKYKETDSLSCTVSREYCEKFTEESTSFKKLRYNG